MRRGGESMKKQALGATIIFALLLLAVPAAWADSSVNFPDGSFSLVVNLGGGVHGNIFWDLPGDKDLFTHHVDFLGNLAFLSLVGFTSGVAYWADFRGTVGGQFLFDVFVTQGGSFFFVGQLLL
jgi:hypothetical protein